MTPGESKNRVIKLITIMIFRAKNAHLFILSFALRFMDCWLDPAALDLVIDRMASALACQNEPLTDLPLASPMHGGQTVANPLQTVPGHLDLTEDSQCIV